MAFNNEEILTLAKAGFTAQQIAALSQVGSAAPTVDITVPTSPTGSQVSTAPAVQTQQSTTPAPAVAPTQLPDGSGVMVAPIAAPTPAPTATTDDILKAISGLSAQVTTGLIQTTPQPTPATAESILAEIINPPQKPTN